MWYPDLCTCGYWRSSDGEFIETIAVAWLEDQHEFNTGTVPAEVTERLKDYAKQSWQPGYFLGFHECSLPATKTARTRTIYELDGHREVPVPDSDPCGHTGTLNIFIPYQGLIYCAPEMIYHYITEHGYAPPAIFCEAVLNAPTPNSAAYFAELRAILPQEQKRKIDVFINSRPNLKLALAEALPTAD